MVKSRDPKVRLLTGLLINGYLVKLPTPAPMPAAIADKFNAALAKKSAIGAK